MNRRHVMLLSLAALAAACSGTPMSPPPATIGTQRVYVLVRDTLFVYAAPLSARSRPVDTVIAGVQAGAQMAVGPQHQVAVRSSAGTLEVFLAPLSSARGPLRQLVPPAQGQMGFDSAGDLAVPAHGLEFYRRDPGDPTSYPTAPDTLRTPAIEAFIGSDQRLYLYNYQGLHVFEPPYTTPAFTDTLPEANFWSAAEDRSGHLYFAAPLSGSVSVFDEPLAADSRAAFVLQGLEVPGGVAVDTAGNVYVTDQGARTLVIYAAPIGPASEPVVTVPISSMPLAVAVEP